MRYILSDKCYPCRDSINIPALCLLIVVGANSEITLYVDNVGLQDQVP
jgi:hypothetical protein